MPLDKSTLISDIKKILNQTKDNKTSQEEAINNYASQLADAIDKYVKSGQVTTTGSATSQTGTIQ